MEDLKEILLVLALAPFTLIAADDPIVTVEQGQVKGITGANLDGQHFLQFLGIPYAKPPLDILRFELPQPPASWTGVRDTGKVANGCIGEDDYTSGTVKSEDCLYLNVYTRNLPNTTSTRKPVMVFIHGGSYTSGSSTPGAYGPKYLMLKDIVLVTLNYRLGLFGFLSSDNLDLGIPGNLGFKDQTMVLKWVQRNIISFNGDPNKVTLFGNSAGSTSVHAHILSPYSKNLFHAAILQSGCVFNNWHWGSKNNAIWFATQTGKNTTTEQEAVDALRSMTASEVFGTLSKLYDPIYPAERRLIGGVMETSNRNEFLTENPVKTINGGIYNQVPILMGYNKDEGISYDLDVLLSRRAGFDPAYSLEKVIPFALNVTSGTEDYQEVLSALSDLYAGKPFSERYNNITDSEYLVGIFEALRLHLKTAKKPIYLYRMSLEGKLNLMKIILNRVNEPGVAHGDEVGYLFDTEISPAVTPGSIEDRAIRNFVELWTNFATDFNPTPNNHLNVTWSPVQNSENIQLLDIGEKLVMKKLPELERLTVWWNILKRWPLINFS